jgi:hypothetical protein
MPAADPPRNRELDRSFAVVAWVVLALALVKGFRPPGRWGATHFAFNYSQGFVRRGLVGEIARRIGGDDVYHYNTYAIFAAVLVVISIVVMARLVQRALQARPTDLGLRATLLVFLASPGLVLLVHLMGYSDWIGTLGLVVFLAIAARSKNRFALYYWALAFGVVLTLVHEGLLPMFAPAMGFIMLCHIAREANTRVLSIRNWVVQSTHAVVSFALMLVPSVYLSVSGTDQVARVRAMQAFSQQHADFQLRQDAIDTLTRSAHENMTVLLPWFWSQERFVRTLKYGEIAFLPGFIFVLVYGCYLIWQSGLPKWQRWVLGPAFLLASLAPQLMNFVGWDWQRWNSTSMTCALACIVAFGLFLPRAETGRLPKWLVPIGLALAVIGLASAAPLFDGFTVQLVPFEQHVDFIKQWIEGGFTHRPAS